MNPSTSSKPKILFWPHIPYRAQFYLRYYWPAMRLKQHGWDIRIIDPRYISAWDEEQMVEDFFWADIIIMFTPKSIVGPRILEMCINHNKKFIIDTDDNTFVVDFGNMAYQWSGVEDVPGLWTSGIHYKRTEVMRKQEMYKRCLFLCDALSVTQPVLASEYERFLGKGDTYVLPNSLDLNFYKPWPKKKNDRIRVGWQGGASHVRDLKIVEKTLDEMYKKHNIKIVFFGQEWAHLEKKFPDAEFHPWVDQDTFHVKLGQLDLDIGLCPIEDTDFNRGKSNLKMLENAVYGVPSVCSKIPSGPYNLPEGIELNDRILIENTDEAWIEAVESLIVDEEKRRFIGGNAKRTLEQAYNIDVTWEYWAECYENVFKRVVEKVS